MRVRYDPATDRSTVDDRWTAQGGVRRGRAEVHREFYEQVEAKITARFYAATGRSVRFDVVGDQVELDQMGR